METLLHAGRLYSLEIGMEFNTEKCTMLIMKSGKWHRTDGMKLPNQDKIRTLGEKETYKYLGILEADTIKQAETKEKNKNDYFRRIRKLLVTKLYSRNLIKRPASSWDNRDHSCSGQFLKWTRKELKQMDQRTRQLMTFTDYICQEKTEEEDLPALKTPLTNRYNNSMTI